MNSSMTTTKRPRSIASLIASGDAERLLASEWDESQHPRDEHGRFAEGGGSGGGESSTDSGAVAKQLGFKRNAGIERIGPARTANSPTHYYSEEPNEVITVKSDGSWTHHRGSGGRDGAWRKLGSGADAASLREHVEKSRANWERQQARDDMATSKHDVRKVALDELLKRGR